MYLDASIPLQAGQVSRVNLMDIMMQAERIKAMQADREFQTAERERAANARGSLAELILGDQGGAQSFPVSNNPALTPDQAGAPRTGALPGGVSADPTITSAQAGAPASKAWQDYVHYDPEGALDYRKTTQAWNKGQFEQAEKFNDRWLQILSGVYDQPSYDRAKNKARALFGQLGQDFNALQVPDVYDPRVVDQARIEATSTKDQLAAIRADRRLEWDIEDDQADNERADRNTDSLISNREGRLAETQRAAQARESNSRRGQDIASTDRRRGQDMTSERANTRSGGAKTTRPVATDGKGNKVEWNGKAWVPVK